MATAAGANPLELTVSNFGPIAAAKVELRPMSVFVGPSNTGKSYLAVLIYALHRFFDGYDAYAGIREFRRGLLDDLSLSEGDVTEILDWVNETFAYPAASDRRRRSYGQLPEPVELPEHIALLTRTVISNVEHASEALSSEIERCFGIDQIENLSGYFRGKNSSGFSLHGNAREVKQSSDSWEYSFNVSGKERQLAALIPDAMPLRITEVRYPSRFYENRQEKPQVRDSEARRLLASFASNIVSEVVGPLSNPAYYLPADRAGVMHAHKVVVRALISSASRAGLRHDSLLPELSGVLADFLQQLLDLVDLSYQTEDDIENLASYLEQNLMRGAISVKQEQIDYPSFVYRPDGWQRNLPLMNTSSMVSELAPVVLYLRHVVEPGDTLIIEEPEAHLHPAMQVEFVRLLAAAVKAGIRVIITTHSEWVLEELANLVLMSELPIEHRAGIEGAELALTPDEIGAWFFETNADGSGSVVKEIPLDKEMGKFPSEFGLVTAELYNRFAKISNRIERLKEG